MIRYGSVCSGVEAATLAWKPLGWECVFVSEVEPFPCAVLQHRLGASRPIHPLDPAETEDEKDAAERRAWMKQNEKLRADGVIPNEGDFTKIGDKYRGKIDLLVGGTPCFPAGNLVLTDFGYKPIEEIKVGDRVISHLDRLCRVVRTGSKIADNVGIMKATNNVDDIFISATANHPFLVGNSESFALVDAEFKPIAECVGRYAARLPENGKYTGFRIEYFEPTNQPQTVYNIEVENDHSYICNGLCVHNCQDLSVAGLRAGFEGERSVLAIDFVRLAYQSNCRWFVWENVPGVFSSNGGGDFATLLSLFTGCEIRVPEQGFGSAGFVCNARRDRFGVAWRVLDAQYVRVPGSFPYGIPQRRRRCFVVGYLGDWRRAAEVLLEPQCMSWPAPTRRKTRKAVAGSPGGCVEDASAIRMRSGCEGGGKGALVGRELSHTLATGNDKMIVTIGLGRDVIKSGENSKFSFSIIENAQPTLTARGEGGVCIKNNAVFDTVISLASGQGGEWGCLGVNVAQTLSLNNGGFHYIACYENHANDSRVTFSGSVCPALTSRAGTGGGNLPLVMSSSELCFDVGNGQVDCSMHPLYECATTLHCMHDANAVMRVPINSMIIGKDVTLTDRQTIGIGEDGDALPTIGAKHHHAVAVASFVGRQGAKAGGIGYAEEVTPTVRASQDIHIVVASFMGGQGGQEGSICFSDELAPTIKASPSLVPDIVVSSFAIAETVIGRETKNGGNGVGAKYEVAYTLDTAGVQGVAVDVVDKQGQFMSDVVPCLTATSFKEAPSILPHLDTNLVEEIKNVKIEKTSPSEVLRILRKTFGEKAFSEWIRRHACFFEEKILQQNMHGSSVRCSSVNVEKNEHMSLPCEKNCPAREMRNLWQGECIGRSSQGQEFSEQRSAESRSDLSELSQQDSSCKKDLCRMWQTAKGAWILREAFGALQEIRQSFTIQTESIRLNSFGYVRRLIPIETERLMGFPDGWTKIPWNGRSEEHCPDGPRYKAAGNSMCVNCMRWIGEQIERVDKMKDESDDDSNS